MIIGPVLINQKLGLILCIYIRSFPSKYTNVLPKWNAPSHDRQKQVAQKKWEFTVEQESLERFAFEFGDLS